MSVQDSIVEMNISTGNFTTEIPTTVMPIHEPNYVVGFICLAITCIFWGTSFLPVKKFEAGDGMFFQLILCCAIWLCGLVTSVIRQNSQFYPLVMVGGFLWATGNVLTVPIIKTVGFGIGLLIWGSFNLIVGWACGRFGFFWINKVIPHLEALNYVGVALAFVRAIIFFFIKTEVEKKPQHPESNGSAADVELRQRLSEKDDNEVSVIPNTPPSVNEDETFFDRLPPIKKRLFGCVLSTIAGILYGCNFVPAIYIMDRIEGSSQNGLDYVFSHFCGIFATSLIYFAIYCAVMKNKPRVYPKIVLPGIFSGVLWSIAQIGAFVATKELSQTIFFPIGTSVPAIIAAVCGIIFFREIRGKKNFILLFVAFIVTLAGSIMTGMSI